MTRLLSTLALLLAGLSLAHAQSAGQAENVRYAYAQVLRVTPVYQTLTATRTEQRCDPPKSAGTDSSLSRVVGKVKNALHGSPSTGENCRTVPVEREFRRPIAYDVDYTFRGAKYRSRLPEDPGNRLRIRISVMPLVGGATSR